MWAQLQDIALSRTSAWIITEDFNDIIHSSEKVGGPARPEGSFSDLRSLMSSCDLYDLNRTGSFLSWRVKRHTHLVRCRLDRVMANSEWIMAYPSGRSEYLRFEGSDHRPLVTSFDPKKKNRKGIYRYDRRLKDNEEVKTLVLEAWNSNSLASVDLRISACRTAIIKWSKNQHLNSQKEISSLREQLEDSMSNNLTTQEEINIINKNVLLAYQKEEAFWKQRSRNLWLALGDKNTGYFHAASKNRRAINNIAVLETSSGLPVYEEDEIISTIADYYN